LTPKQNSSGGKARQGGISKAGNTYLRRLLFIGAIAVIRSKRAQQAGSWLAKLLERRPAKVVAIALANKTARVIWAMLRSGVGRHEKLDRGDRKNWTPLMRGVRRRDGSGGLFFAVGTTAGRVDEGAGRGCGDAAATSAWLGSAADCP
jgi:transposase